MMAVVILGIITVFPDYGVISLSIKLFPDMPIAVTVFGLIWSTVIVLVLPISLRWFQIISTTSVTAIMGLSVYSIWQFMPAIFNAWPWYMWAVVLVSVAVGWLLVATPLWRWTKGTLPVAQTDDTHKVEHL